MYFRSRTRRCFLLQFHLIVISGSADEISESTIINLIALEKINRSPGVAFEARVEELVRIWQARPVGKGKLHLIFVGVADRDHSVVRPHWASHPLPFLDYLPVGLKDALADAGQRFATPVCESCEQLVNTFRWIHWIFIPRFLFRSYKQFYWVTFRADLFETSRRRTWPFHIQSPERSSTGRKTYLTLWA